MLARWIICLVAVLFTISCGKKDNDSPDVEPVDTRQVFSLSGIAASTWIQDCQTMEDGNTSGHYSLILNDNTFEMRWVNFDGATCDEGLKRSTFNERQKKVVSEDNEKISGWTTYASVVDSISLILHQQVIVANYNKKKYYGQDGWEINVEKNISGLAASEGDTKALESGYASERTMLVEGDKLYFATYSGNVPVANKEHPFTRQ